MTDNIHIPVADKLKSIINSSVYIQIFTQEQRALIELLYSALTAGVDPSGLINENGRALLYNAIGIDINTLSSLPASSLDVDDQIKIDTKDIICSSFSNNKDLSLNYPFANPVNQYTCSHNKVSNHICVLPQRQQRCPYYEPDFSHHSTYTLESDSQIFFKVYRHRSTSGHSVYTLYDNQNNVIHVLSYDVDTVYDNSKEDFDSEISSIVLQTYLSIDPNARFKTEHHNQKSDLTSDPGSSYIATLVSLS